MTFAVVQRKDNTDSNQDKNTGDNEKMRSDSILSTEFWGEIICARGGHEKSEMNPRV